MHEICHFRGWQGLVAFGCQNLVVVVDPRTIQVRLLKIVTSA